MAQFRKKPVVVEAIQFNNLNKSQIEAFVGDTLVQEIESETAYIAGIAPPISSLSINTKEGVMKAFPGDWIIKEPFPTGDREFYPCKPDIFEQTYEPVGLTSLGLAEMMSNNNNVIFEGMAKGDNGE
jgi:hypothetical protein